MYRPVAYAAAFLMACLLFVDRAPALVVEEPVTPVSVHVKDSKFTVTAEKGKDGLIHFTIVYRPPRLQYLVAHFELRKGGATLAKIDAPAFVREESATYYVAVAPADLAGAKFDLSENYVDDHGGKSGLPSPDGAIYRIDLQAFGKDAPAAKAD
jgi:hypothetical protein